MKYKIKAWLKTFWWVIFKLNRCYWFGHNIHDDYCPRCDCFTWADDFIPTFKRINCKHNWPITPFEEVDKSRCTICGLTGYEACDDGKTVNLCLRCCYAEECKIFEKLTNAITKKAVKLMNDAITGEIN